MASHLDICNMALIRAGHVILDDTAHDPPNIDGTGEAEVLCNLIYEPKRDLLLTMKPWRFAMRTLFVDYEDQILDITGATVADPVVITCAGHGFTDYRNVLITDVEGMTELNGNTYRIANAATNTFELYGVDGSAFDAYTSGGKVRLRPPIGYEYELSLPSDFLRDWQLIGSEAAYDIEAGAILTDEEEVYLQYISRVTDAAQYGPDFVWLLSRFMAIDMAQKLADSKTLVREIQAEFDELFKTVGVINALAGSRKDRTTRERDCSWQRSGR